MKRLLSLLFLAPFLCGAATQEYTSLTTTNAVIGTDTVLVYANSSFWQGTLEAMRNYIWGEFNASSTVSWTTNASKLLPGVVNNSIAGAQLNIDATAETEIEAVVDLQDLQGAVTDGQIPAAIARDSELHAAVTVDGTPDYITLAGQVLTRAQIDLTTDVTGVLPLANYATGTPDGTQYVKDDGSLDDPRTPWTADIDGAGYSVTNIDSIEFTNATATTIYAGTVSPTNQIAGTKVAFADGDSNFTATDVESAIEELDDVNGSGPNATDGKVSWSQLVNVPAGFADGSDDGGAGTGYATIETEGTPVTQRAIINFGSGFTVADDAGNTETDVGLNAYLLDLADGELTGSAVGEGINATNITTGTLNPMVLPDEVALDSEVGLAAYTVTTTDASLQPIYTNSLSSDTTVAYMVDVVGRGPTNSAFYQLSSLWMNSGGTTTLVGSNTVTSIESSAGMNSYFTLSSPSTILNVQGMAGEEINWTATPIIRTGVNGAADAGISYLVNEGFEGVGLPSSWTASGTVDWDDAVIYKEGSESVSIGAGTATGYVITPTYAGATDFYCRFAVYFDVLPSATRIIAQLRNGTDNEAQLYATSGGVFQFKQDAGTAAQPVATFAADTWYYVWLHYTAGTGSDGYVSVAFNTTLSEPVGGNNFAEQSDGTSLLAITNMRLRKDEGVSSGALNFDDVRGAAVSIGNDP